MIYDILYILYFIYIHIYCILYILYIICIILYKYIGN